MGHNDSATSTDRPATAERILDLAREHIQQRGYNAVSYGDLADELDLTTAALHYHFPSKADLVQALVRRYRRRNAQERAALRRQHDTLRELLAEYVEAFSAVVEAGGLCLCGILAADHPTLPEGVQEEVRRFFADQEDWLTDLFDTELSNGTGLQGCDTSRDVARLFLATLEGAMLTTPNRNPDTYTETLHQLIDSIVT